jgi:ribosomal 50S subunit-associated protein YjgA (DUF615 family)
MQSDNKLTLPENIIEATNSIKEIPSDEIRNRLISLINELINYDFHALVQLLYRIDVNEKKLKDLLKENTGTESSSIIADLIIDRQLQKIALKKEFSKNQTPPPDESW